MSALLFAVATWGDRRRAGACQRTPRPLIYALSLGVYCTSWTYFGSVGVASRSGFDFLPIYIGPILVFAVGWKLLADDRRNRQAPEHHLDRRFHRRALRQKRIAGRARGSHRRRRHHSLHLDTAQGRFLCARDHDDDAWLVDRRSRPRCRSARTLPSSSPSPWPLSPCCSAPAISTRPSTSTG